MAYIVIIIPIIFWIIYIYNKLIRSKNMTKEAFSDIDVQLKRRYDLIPNLVEIVKQSSRHEKELFENIADIRSKSISTSSIKKRNEQETEFSQSLKNVFAIIEDYPEIKSNNNYAELQKSLSDIEDQLQYARRYYNGTVRDYNILIESFPNNIFASIFKYKKQEFFEIQYVTQRNNPEVSV